MSLSGFDPGFAGGPRATELPDAVDFSKAGKNLEQRNSAQPFSPLLTEGIFPYQPNPVAALIAAGLTLGAMSLKETGKIDLDGILYMLNSADFYAGVIGSAVTSWGEQRTQMLLRWLAVNKAPPRLKVILDSSGGRILNNIVNSFVYMFAVSSSYEYFSQFWKIATKNIPEARTVGGLWKARRAKKYEVAMNLFYYYAADPNMQKRVINSVFYHRIMTFEFIATNIALFVGNQIGMWAAKQYAGDASWAQIVFPALFSTLGGIAVQYIPDSMKSAANLKLLDWKIAHNETALKDLLLNLEDGVQNRVYPAGSEIFAGTFFHHQDLQSDLDRVTRTRDLLTSLDLERTAYLETNGAIASDQSFNQVFGSVEQSLQKLVDGLKAAPSENLDEQMNTWLEQKRSPREIQELGQDFLRNLSKEAYYKVLLEGSLRGVHEKEEETKGLLNYLSKNLNLSQLVSSAEAY